VLDIGAVINGLFFLFLEPNPQDPLNKEAAELMKVIIRDSTVEARHAHVV
jgi:ubiquitin-protein ligase